MAFSSMHSLQPALLQSFISILFALALVGVGVNGRIIVDGSDIFSMQEKRPFTFSIEDPNSSIANADSLSLKVYEYETDPSVNGSCPLSLILPGCPLKYGGIIPLVGVDTTINDYHNSTFDVTVVISSAGNFSVYLLNGVEVVDGFPRHAMVEDVTEIWEFMLGIFFSTVGKVCINLGVALEKYALNKNNLLPPHERKPPGKLKVWWVGLILFLAGNLGDVVALAFAQPSTVAALGGLSIVFNIVFSACFLKEKFSIRDMIASVFIIGGSTLATVFGSTVAMIITVDVFEQLASRLQFQLFLAPTIIAFIGLVATSEVLLRRIKKESVAVADVNQSPTPVEASEEKVVPLTVTPSAHKKIELAKIEKRNTHADLLHMNPALIERRPSLPATLLGSPAVNITERHIGAGSPRLAPIANVERQHTAPVSHLYPPARGAKKDEARESRVTVNPTEDSIPVRNAKRVLRFTLPLTSATASGMLMLGVKILIEFLQVTFGCAPVLPDSASTGSGSGGVVVTQNITYEYQCFYNNQMVYWHPYIVFTFNMIVGTANIHYMNEALALFDALFVVPIFLVWWSVVAIIGGGLIFDDFSTFTALDYAMFVTGCALNFIGVVILAFRAVSPNKGKDGSEVEGEGGEGREDKDGWINRSVQKSVKSEVSPVQSPKKSGGNVQLGKAKKQIDKEKKLADAKTVPKKKDETLERNPSRLKGSARGRASVEEVKVASRKESCRGHTGKKEEIVTVSSGKSSSYPEDEMSVPVEVVQSRSGRALSREVDKLRREARLGEADSDGKSEGCESTVVTTSSPWVNGEEEEKKKKKKRGLRHKLPSFHKEKKSRDDDGDEKEVGERKGKGEKKRRRKKRGESVTPPLPDSEK